jgi:signal transduction histidine kinase/ActR/RegA family two-component response regulator
LGHVFARWVSRAAAYEGLASGDLAPALLMLAMTGEPSLQDRLAPAAGSDPLTALVAPESVQTVDELVRRPGRAPDHEAENRALSALLEALGRRDGNAVQELADQALALCQANSAGVSILERDEFGRQLVHCRAGAGQWSDRLGGMLPRDRSPCGLVIERDQPLLVVQPERRARGPATGASGVSAAPAAEALLVPLSVEGRPVGALWVLLHDASRRFDGEDLRLLTSLARCAALALQSVHRAELDHERATELAGMRQLQALSSHLVQSEDDATLYQHVVDVAREIMRSNFASLQIYHPERDELQQLAHRGFDPAVAAGWLWLKSTAGTVCGLAVQSRRRVVVPDVDTSAELAGTQHPETYRNAGIQALQSTPLLSRKGTIVGMLSTHWARPTTPSEDDLRLLDVLARLAADLLERTQGEQDLREADRRKSEFLAMLAHEMRNPLASIHNALEIVRLMGDDAEAVASASAIMDRQVAQLVRVVDDLLDISRISRGRIELRKQRVDLATVIHQAVETVAPMAKHFDQPLTVELPPHPVRLDADPARLTQVFSNLLNNACKYSDPGARIRVAVRTTRGEPPLPGSPGRPGDAVVSVRDEGIGIAADQLARIFELFAQVDSSVERSQGGLGIGLTLVKSLVEQHGGQVEVHSDGPGRGSEFVVRLPLLHEAAAAGAAGDEAGASEGRKKPAAKRRILVVDDNRDSADSLALLLRSAGHETATAYGGEEAVEVAHAFRPDVVLLDLGMPHVNGYEACKLIRSTPWGRDMVIIAQTGWGQDDDRAQTGQSGFQGHLTKPVNQNDLARLLAQLSAGVGKNQGKSAGR